MTIGKPLAVIGCLLLFGCMTLEGKPTAFSSCSFDHAWDASIGALADFQLQAADKATGALETNWVEVAASMQAGIMQRDVNKERVKYVVEIKRNGTGAVAAVLQLREEWSPMGARSRQWRAIPGNSSEESAVAAEIARRLKEKGC